MKCKVIFYNGDEELSIAAEDVSGTKTKTKINGFFRLRKLEALGVWQTLFAFNTEDNEI